METGEEGKETVFVFYTWSIDHLFFFSKRFLQLVFVVNPRVYKMVL